MTDAPPPGDPPRRRRRSRIEPAELPLEPVPPSAPAPGRPEVRRRNRRTVDTDPGETGPDLFTPRPEPVRPAVEPEGPAMFPAPPPAEIAVQRVAPDTLLRGGSKPDAYLYLLADRAEAPALLRDGLGTDAADPPRLVERAALPALLSALEEEGGGLGSAVVLRVRAAAVADLVEPDPDRRGGWLLSGGAGN